ncbi:O-antigen ligase family protein [Streptomyces beihaiensis]|uniref:O-antigen ligase family protein n=1 Tax=Streptomyces beihaiensis TaxID=2984495 RepID=A0ABT3U065_9ACTN|nr:O-antigen ligase family protein [Streptomyces beihaiensis]MCX3062704.1 O-antigen ligase family protein [Streptomyces beihaiensis]
MLRAARRAVRRTGPVVPLLVLVGALGLPLGAGATGTGGGATPADAVSGLVVCFAAVRAVRTRQRPLGRTAFAVLGLPVVAVAVAALGAATPSDAVQGLVRYLQVVVLLPGAVLLLVRDRADFRRMGWGLVGLALWQGAIGVYQYATGTGASYAGEDIRAVGTFGATDVMGMATVVSYGIVCALALALAGPTRRARLTAGCCALALTVPLALSFSRGAWIATALICVVLIASTGLRRAARLFLVGSAAAVVLVGGFGVGTTMLQERLSSITRVTAAPDQSVTDRYTMWAAAVDMWKEHPATGVGLKNFPAYRDSHSSIALSAGSDVAGAGTSYRRQPLLSPHNMYLLVLSEQGLVGLCAIAGGWLALLVCGLRRLVTARRTARGPDCALLACGLLTWQLTDFVYGDIGGPSTVLTGVVLGLGAWWALAQGAVAREDVTREDLVRVGPVREGLVREGPAREGLALGAEARR